MKEIDAGTLRGRLNGGAEIALLDVREQGEFGTCHLFHAINTPLSRIELQVPRLVPRTSVAIVVTAAGDADLVRRAVEVLASLGYSDLAVCPAGPQSWEAAGFTLYSGINVPSKAFGEAVEHHYGTPSIDAVTLKAMQDKGDDIVVLDSRTEAEYRNMNIPQGVSMPGGELAYRVRDFVADPATTVVVNCAGRTRSIIGAQSVINSGIANRVVALENGTMGWHLAGFDLEHGSDRRYADGEPHTLAAALEMRDRVAREYGISTIDRDTLDRWRMESDRRTLYLLDVRAPGEYAAGHLPGSRSAPGGQLVQATDFHIGVPNGRIVLIDDTGVRATMTAHWLVQMGLPDVHVLSGGLEGHALETGPTSGAVPGMDDIDWIDASELAVRLGEDGPFVLDVGESREYRKHHLPGARWAIRSRIAQSGPDLPADGEIVLTSGDGDLAALAVPEVRALSGARVRVLAGGTEKWLESGHPFEASPGDPADEACVDVYLRAYDRNTDIEAKMQEYIDWEIALIDQISGDSDVLFRLGPV
ncbi:MAG: thiosulfate sulfurtransferase [Alphaproteobacteria bacterium]|nr:thiosulfate sulfurtransferase [Alphaproteobacteria bacterium]